MHEPHRRYDDPRSGELFRCYMAAKYGSHLQQSELDVITDDEIGHLVPKVPVHITRAWLRLMVALRDIYEDLNASRPAPVYTEIGLSPKVNKTLQDARLDLDLTTRRLCPLGWRWATVINKYGEEERFKFYFPMWPKGTVFGSSRFADCDCEACGKTIPSGKFVPVLVANKTGTEHGFWFGRDCARNILGIKDAGIDRE